MQNRFVTLLAFLSIGVGLVFGVLVGAQWIGTDNGDTIQLAASAQDDFIIMIAEAYASDNNGRLAQERLSRVPDEHLSAHVEKLALSYAPQHDLIAANLAHLAVALGSRNSTLLALNVQRTDVPAEHLNVQQPMPSNTPLVQSSPEAQPLPNATATQVALAPSQAAATPIPPTSTGELTVRPNTTPTTHASYAPQKSTNDKSANANLSPSGLAPMPKNLIARTINIDLPRALGESALSIPLTARPTQCTPANQMPAVVNQTLALCAGQTYQAFRVDGANLTVFGDTGGTAIIRGTARGFAITVTGNNIAIVGVHIDAQTDPGDLNKWLCFYAACSFKDGAVNGGTAYGGGILLDNTTNAAVISSFVSHGTIGVASSHGFSNKIVQNNFSNLNGWGTLSLFTNHDYIVGNVMHQINRPCLGLDGSYYQSGCESSGAAFIASQANIISDNHCDHSGDCFYAPGDGGFASNDNKFYNNYCAATNANCFEITFSSGNEFDYNIATSDPDTHETCYYPFWIAGSTVRFGSHNTWSCKRDFNKALQDSHAATDKPTEVQPF